MRKPKHYYNRTYKSDYMFFIGWPEKQFQKYCLEVFKVRAKTAQNGGLVFEVFDSFGNPYIIMWIRDKKDVSYISHECNHAAAITLNRVGVKASFDNDEAFCYLSQDIMEFALGK